MDEQIKFIRALGQKKKRHASLISIELTVRQGIHVVSGDSLTISGADQETGSEVKVHIIFAESTYWRPGDSIRIETELIPSITTITLKKAV